MQDLSKPNIKLPKKEIKEIRDLQFRYIEIHKKWEIVNASMNEKSDNIEELKTIFDRGKEILEEIDSIRKIEKQIFRKIEKKYGKGELDLQTLIYKRA